VKLFIAFHLADSTREACAGIQRAFLERVGRAAVPGKSTSTSGSILNEAAAIVRPVPPEKMHVTAVFIGDVDQRTADRIGTVFYDCIASLRGAGVDALESNGGGPPRRNRGFPGAPGPGGTVYLPSLAVGGVGAFPSVRRPRVIWAGATDPRGVAVRWSRALHTALRLSLDTRSFVPHVTIAYPRRRLNRDQRRALLQALSPGGEVNAAAHRSPEPAEGRDLSVRVPRIAVVESIPTDQGTRYEDLFWIDL
jgi:2'-5' RNA ligase